MPKEMQDTLDYEGKIDRSSENIGMLIAAGEKAAAEFLRQRAEVVAKSPLTITAGGWRAAIHGPSSRAAS